MVCREDFLVSLVFSNETVKSLSSDSQSSSRDKVHVFMSSYIYIYIYTISYISCPC